MLIKKINTFTNDVELMKFFKISFDSIAKNFKNALKNVITYIFNHYK